MKTFRMLIVSVVTMASAGVQAQDAAPDPLLASFETIIADLNRNDFDSFVAAIDQKELLGRVFEQRLIDKRVKDGIENSFGADVKNLYFDSFPKVNGEILGKVVGFRRNGNRAVALVRWDMPQFKFIYHEFDLMAGSRGRARIVDWVDFGGGQRFSDDFGETLVTVIADEGATRSLLRPISLTDPEAFQVAELLKAARDAKHARYFDILPGLDTRIREHRFIVPLTLQMARASRDRGKYMQALAALHDHFSGDPLYAITLTEYYLPRRDYGAARVALQGLGERLGVEDPALKSHLATLSLLVGENQAASDYAEAAVAADPGLELAWWAVLRSRTANERYDEAMAALAALEAEFGHKLTAETLERDSLLAQLTETEPFKRRAEPGPDAR